MPTGHQYRMPLVLLDPEVQIRLVALYSAIRERTDWQACQITIIDLAEGRTQMTVDVMAP